MARNKSTSLKTLAPNSFDIGIDGKTVRVAANKYENAIMNMVLASQMRSKIQEMMAKYDAGEMTLTPKELRDLVASAKDIATFSGEVYATAEPIEAEEKPAEKADVTDIDFSEMKKVAEPKETDGNTT